MPVYWEAGFAGKEGETACSLLLVSPLHLWNPSPPQYHQEGGAWTSDKWRENSWGRATWLIEAVSCLFQLAPLEQEVRVQQAIINTGRNVSEQRLDWSHWDWRRAPSRLFLVRKTLTTQTIMFHNVGMFHFPVQLLGSQLFWWHTMDRYVWTRANYSQQYGVELNRVLVL